MENNHVHLCNSCCKSYPQCSDDEHAIEFGDGVGGDNICCCNKYEPLLERDYGNARYVGIPYASRLGTETDLKLIAQSVRKGGEVG